MPDLQTSGRDDWIRTSDPLTPSGLFWGSTCGFLFWLAQVAQVKRFRVRKKTQVKVDGYFPLSIDSRTHGAVGDPLVTQGALGSPTFEFAQAGMPILGHQLFWGAEWKAKKKSTKHYAYVETARSGTRMEGGRRFPSLRVNRSGLRLVPFRFSGSILPPR